MLINEKQKNHAKRFVVLTVFMFSIGFGIIMPVLPELITEVTGDDLSTAAVDAGWLALAYAVMQFFFGPIIGNLSDRFDENTLGDGSSGRGDGRGRPGGRAQVRPRRRAGGR